MGGLFVLRAPRRRYLALALPLAATLLPLFYGVVLSRTDASWRAFQSESMTTGTAPWWALLASFGPLVAFAGLGLRRPRDDRDWMLVLWPMATAAIYFLVPQFPPHALAGVSIPLAVLAVRGWARVAAGASTRASTAPRSPGLLGAALATAAVLAVTVPAAVHHAQGVRD